MKGERGREKGTGFFIALRSVQNDTCEVQPLMCHSERGEESVLKP